MAEALKVLILGGGFAGLELASRLEAMGLTGGPLEVTLVSRADACTLTPLLVDVLTGVLAPEHAVKTLSGTLQRTELVIGEIESIVLKSRRVAVRTTAGRRVLAYDHVVLALGGVSDAHALPGAERAYTFWSMNDALALRARVLETLSDRRPPRLAVVGGGLLGVEVAAELAGWLSRDPRGAEAGLTIVAASDRLLPGQGTVMAAHVTDALTRRGVDVVLNGHVEAIGPEGLALEGGMAVPADVVVLAAGVRPNPLVKDLAVPHDRLGRVMTHPSLQSLTRPEVWALGDCAAVPTREGFAASLAQHAVRQAEVLASNFEALVGGRGLGRYHHETVGVMATLGPREAIAEVEGWTVWGEGVWWARRAYYAWALPSSRTRLGLMADWAAEAFRRPWRWPTLLEGIAPPAIGPSILPGRMTVTWVATPPGAARRTPEGGFVSEEADG